MHTGASRRLWPYLQVAGYVRTRTVEEVLDMVKHGLKGGKFGPSQNGVTIASKRQVRLHLECSRPTCSSGACAMQGRACMHHDWQVGTRGLTLYPGTDIQACPPKIVPACCSSIISSVRAWPQCCPALLQARGRAGPSPVPRL